MSSAGFMACVALPFLLFWLGCWVSDRVDERSRRKRKGGQR